MRTYLTIWLLTLDNTMSVPPQFIETFGHFGWGILIILAVVWAYKETGHPRPGQGN